MLSIPRESVSQYIIYFSFLLFLLSRIQRYISYCILSSIIISTLSVALITIQKTNEHDPITITQILIIAFFSFYILLHFNISMHRFIHWEKIERKREHHHSHERVYFCRLLTNCAPYCTYSTLMIMTMMITTCWWCSCSLHTLVMCMYVLYYWWSLLVLPDSNIIWIACHVRSDVPDHAWIADFTCGSEECNKIFGIIVEYALWWASREWRK